MLTILYYVLFFIALALTVLGVSVAVQVIAHELQWRRLLRNLAKEGKRK